MAKEKELSPSRFLASKVIYAVFQILKDHGNEMKMRDLMMEVEKKVDLNEWEKERYEKSTLYDGNPFYIFSALIV